VTINCRDATSLARTVPFPTPRIAFKRRSERSPKMERDRLGPMALSSALSITSDLPVNNDLRSHRRREWLATRVLGRR
jgi:hypothetical protein